MSPRDALLVALRFRGCEPRKAGPAAWHSDCPSCGEPAALGLGYRHGIGVSVLPHCGRGRATILVALGVGEVVLSDEQAVVLTVLGDRARRGEGPAAVEAVAAATAWPGARAVGVGRTRRILRELRRAGYVRRHATQAGWGAGSRLGQPRAVGGGPHLPSQRQEPAYAYSEVREVPLGLRGRVAA
jgi:hypothetical protein